MKATSIFSIKFHQGYFKNHRRNNHSKLLSATAHISANSWMNHVHFFES